MKSAPPSSAPSFREALRFWFRLGCIGFGGPAGQIALLHDFLVDKKRWISPAKFSHALNYCMLLPGPEAQQLATYSGWLLHGVRGGLAAGILFVLPSAVLLWGLSICYVRFGHLPAVQAAFEFLKPAVLAIVFGAILKIGKRSLITPLHISIAVVAFISIYFLNLPFPWIMLGAILIGIGMYYGKPTRTTIGNSVPEKPESLASTETEYLIHEGTVVAGAGWSATRFFRQTTITLVLWMIPLALFAAFAPDFGFWKKLAFFFTKAALVTFGGAYAVLPYVAQVSVEQFAWLTQTEMLDGLALGETTPGPLIIVLAFVGFMAGHHAFGGSLLAASLGLVTTVWYTFLPSFFFIFAGAPLLEHTQSNLAWRSILQFTSAAVAGVMFSLCFYFGKAILLPTPPDIQWMALGWTLISILALQYFRLNLLVWIGISLLMGLVKQLFFSVG